MKCHWEVSVAHTTAQSKVLQLLWVTSAVNIKVCMIYPERLGKYFQVMLSLKISPDNAVLVLFACFYIQKPVHCEQ